MIIGMSIEIIEFTAFNTTQTTARLEARKGQESRNV